LRDKFGWFSDEISLKIINNGQFIIASGFTIKPDSENLFNSNDF